MKNVRAIIELPLTFSLMPDFRQLNDIGESAVYATEYRWM